jgi:single-stranded DNA-binding protein
MENKAIVEGMITNLVKINKFGGTFLKIHTKREYEFKGQKGIDQAYLDVEVPERIAAQVVERFKKGDMVRVEGSNKPKEVKDITDAEGYKIFKANIKAYKVDAMVLNENLAPLPEKLQTTPATQRQNQAFEAAKPLQPQRQTTPVFKKQMNTYEQRPQRPAPQQQLVDDEDPFGDRNGDPLPF